MKRLVGLSLACAALAIASPAPAEPRLTATPQAQAAHLLPSGVSALGKGAFAYRPQLQDGVRPGVLVLFHGAGGDARRFLELFRGEADRRQLILLSIQSIGTTWDVVRRGSRDLWNVGRASPAPAVGADSRNVNAALKTLFAREAADPQRIIAAGFSDGASYALSLGMENDQLFSGIVALAPGFASDTPFRRAQRIAIAHGRYDQILSYSRADQIARELGNRGYRVSFLPFAGDHQVDRGSLTKALDFVLSPSAG